MIFDDRLYGQDEPDFIGRWFAEPQPTLAARWIFLRALGAIFFSAFYALYFQIHGLIGARGILPVADYLRMVRQVLGVRAYTYVPSLLWLNASDAALSAIVWTGLIASVLVIVNVWPRLSIAVAGVCFLSFVAAAQDFSSYQSDGMLLEAAFLSIFFAPRGVLPGIGRHDPPNKAALFLLQWEWFRIYFESGVVKILSGEEQWRYLTAMDKYYENGPLPTWIGWYAQHLPHGFHAFTAGATLVIELLVVWLLFFPKRSRLICFLITTPLQIGIIITANYAFLNYLVLFLGVLLLSDRDFGRMNHRDAENAEASVPSVPLWFPISRRHHPDRSNRREPFAVIVVLILFFATSIEMFLLPNVPLLNAPAMFLAPFRIVNNYGLFAVMTRARYEIEFQGSRDLVHWTPYPFAYKPQDPNKAPRIYAPYQPRFDWNLWFASLGTVEDNRWVMNTQVRLLENSPPVLQLFAGDPFGRHPPSAVRAVVWQYWFSTSEEHRRTGAWWDRRLVGAYAPTAIRRANGTIEFERQ